MRVFPFIALALVNVPFIVMSRPDANGWLLALNAAVFGYCMGLAFAAWSSR